MLYSNKDRSMPTNVVVTMLFNGLQHTDEVSKPQARLQGSLAIFSSYNELDIVGYPKRNPNILL